MRFPKVQSKPYEQLHRPITVRTWAANCPAATRLGQDQYRCGKCSVVWDIDEPRPSCQAQDPAKEEETKP